MAQFAIIVNRHHRSVADSTVRSIARSMIAIPRVIQPRRDLAVLIAHESWENPPDVPYDGNRGSFVLGPHQRMASSAPSATALLERQPQVGGLDWPFVAGAWDKERVRVVMDPLGIRAAWWAETPEAFLVASAPSLLIAHPKMSVEPNIGVLAERLSYRPTTPNESVYSGMTLVAAGSMLELSGSTTPSERRWHEWDWSVSTASFREAAESIGSLSASVIEAEVARRSPQMSTLQLSGGLDSSAIAGVMANAGYDSGMVAMIRNYPGLPADERQYQDAVLAGRDFEVVRYAPAEFDIERDLEEPLAHSRLPKMRIEPAHTIGSRHLAEAGRRAAFIGEGGDELYGVQDGSLAGLLNARAWSKALSHARRRSARRHAQEHLEFFPTAMQRSRIRPREWLRPDFVRRSDVAARIVPHRTRFGERARQQSRLDVVTGTGWYALAAEIREARYHELGTEEISLFLHPDLMQQALRIPDALRSSDDDARALQRAAFVRVLPEALINRRGKVHFDHRHASDLGGDAVRSLVEDMSLARDGILDETSVQLARQHLLDALGNPRQRLPALAGPLWAVIGHEVWWRATFGR